MDRTVYGLSVEEQVDLDSEDEEFFGEQNTDSVAGDSSSCSSDSEEYEEGGVLDEGDCHLHYDNCVGQNKNNYVVGYLAWRVLKQKHNNITLSFMRVGHTRCLVDGHFGLIKKIYRQSDSDTLKQISQVVNRSSFNNVAQIFDWQ